MLQSRSPKDIPLDLKILIPYEVEGILYPIDLHEIKDQNQGFVRLKMVMLMNLLSSMMSIHTQMEQMSKKLALLTEKRRNIAGGAIPDRLDIFRQKYLT